MKLFYYLFLIILCLASVQTEAQINLKDKLKTQSNNRANDRVDQGIDKGLDAVESGVKGVFKKKDKKTEEAVEEQEDTQDQAGEAEEAANEAKAKTEAKTTPTLQAYSKFDFIPGQKIIFYDDFSQDAVGDFPALWFSNGSGEVMNLNNYPGKWLGITAEGCYFPDRDLQLGENFTVEFDLIGNFEQGDPFNIGLYVVSGNVKDPNEGGAIPGVAGVKTSISPWSIDLSGYSDGQYVGDAQGKIDLKPSEKVHFSYWIQKQRMRIYMNEKKVIDAPRILPAGYKYNILRFENGGDSKPLIANFRVAAGLPDTRNKLITEGKLVTYGIYFDVNSDKVKPESYGTLKDIASVLNEVPDIRVKIFGHTDSDGEDAKNLDLSKRRAASVKRELAQSFGVNADRLDTDGMGETKPVAPNDTPVNKALNRRVEFIKL